MDRHGSRQSPRRWPLSGDPTQSWTGIDRGETPAAGRSTAIPPNRGQASIGPEGVLTESWTGIDRDGAPATGPSAAIPPNRGQASTDPPAGTRRRADPISDRHRSAPEPVRRRTHIQSRRGIDRGGPSPQASQPRFHPIVDRHRLTQRRAAGGGQIQSWIQSWTGIDRGRCPPWQGPMPAPQRVCMQALSRPGQSLRRLTIPYGLFTDCRAIPLFTYRSGLAPASLSASSRRTTPRNLVGASTDDVGRIRRGPPRAGVPRETKISRSSRPVGYPGRRRSPRRRR